MRSVRCDICGTKALIAASQCPKCGHLFEMRDGSGEPVPAAHCPSCDSYYPAYVESCKWCGTTLTAEKPRKGNSDMAKWIAGGVFAAAVGLGYIARDTRPPNTTRHRQVSESKPKAAARAETAVSVAATVPAGSVKSRDTSQVAGDVVVSGVSTTDHSASSASVAAIPQSASTSPAVLAPPVVTTNPDAPKTPPASTRPSSPWVSMVAKQWAIVRADAQGSAHIVASVGPNARVQLGESRGSWRRIRARGISGWVDVSRASFVATRTSPRRTRTTAGR